MILELLLILCLFVSFTSWGIWAKMLLRDKNNSFSLTILLGLLLFSVLTCVFSFFIPLSFYVEMVLLILSLIPFFFKKLRVNAVCFPVPLLKQGWFWLFCIVFIFAGSYYPFRPDHFFYYEPSLNWLNRYGLLPGVANIDWALGQMSVFHIIQAGLDQTIDPFQRLSVFITILFLVYIFERRAYLLLLAIPFYFLFIQAPSPDVAIVFLSLVVVNELCFNYRIDNYKVLFFISVFIFTIKPVAFWLPLWVFITGIYRNKKELKDYRIYLIPTFLVILFLIKNGIASSTLFYPVSFTKLNTYWLPDLRILELSDLKASLFTFDDHFTGDEIRTMSFFQKIYYWLTISKLQTIINCMIAITIVATGIFSFKKKNFLYQSLWIIIVIKSLIVFSFSGQYRFILDGIYPLLFIMFQPVQISKTKIYVAGLSFSLAILVLISYPKFLNQIIPDFKLIVGMDGFMKKTLLIPGYYNVVKYTKGTIGNLDFNISYFSFDYGTPPPAFTRSQLQLYYDMGIFPQMKDPANIRKGFYMKMLEPDEKEKLEKIIETKLTDK